MYSISNEYKVACKALTRQSKTKIVINNITYDGSQYIKDYPKFSHSNDTMIGGFPIKSAEFSLWIKNGPIEIVDKEIKIYRGLLINEVVEWIPQGVFYAEAEDITTSDTGEYITVKCYDNAKKLGTKIYKDNNTYPLSETDYIKNVISQAGYEVDENVFVESNYMMQQKPNMPETTNCREIISRYAEQRGAIALFSRLGKVQIKKPTEIDFTYLFYQYKKLNCETTYGPLNQLILGNKNIENNVIFPSGQQSYPWNIGDNPFLDLIKESRREEVYSQIEGQELTPFTLESALDSFYLDINDIISVQKKDGSYVDLTILSIETENRLKCKISASVQNKKDISYGLAGSIKEDIDSIKFEVDYNKKQITAAVTKANEASEQVSDLSIELGKIQTRIKDVAKLTDSAEKIGIVELNNVNESEPVELEIYPTTEDICYTYLKNTLRLSNTAFLRGRTVVFENITTNEKIEYELPSDLRFLGNEHDTFTLNLNQHICTVIKRIGVNSSGEKYLLETPSTKTFTYPTINLTSGNYKIYVKSCKNTAHIKCALMTQNVYTDQFWTKVEAESKITQTINDITLNVNKKLENYSTTSEMNSAIILKANEITNTVSSTYATKNQLNIAKSEIKQTIDSITSIVNTKISTADLNDKLKKYSTTVEMNSAITQKANSITQSVNAQITSTNGKITNLQGTVALKLDTKDLFSEFNVAVNKVVINSDNFKLDAKGNMKASNVDLTGKITASSGSIGGASIDGHSLFYNNGSTGWGLHGTTDHANIAFHVGTNATNIGGAPLRILHDGSVYTSKLFVEGGQIQIIQTDSNRRTPIILSQVYGGNTYRGQMGGGGTSFYKNDVMSIVLNTSTSGGNGTLTLYNTANTNEYNYVTPTGVRTTSDIRYKEHINDIPEEISLNIITNLNPITYTYKNGNDYHRGLSAQEVEQVLLKNNITNQIFSCEYDEVNEDERYSLNYTELIPDLINVCKYLTKQVEKLKLERRLSDE